MPQAGAALEGQSAPLHRGGGWLAARVPEPAGCPAREWGFPPGREQQQPQHCRAAPLARARSWAKEGPTSGLRCPTQPLRAGCWGTWVEGICLGHISAASWKKRRWRQDSAQHCDRFIFYCACLSPASGNKAPRSHSLPPTACPQAKDRLDWGTPNELSLGQGQVQLGGGALLLKGSHRSYPKRHTPNTSNQAQKGV